MKYLELIKGQFTAEHEARAKQEEPYVAYSEEAGGVMYTFIPAPVVGPADNEIWYTSSDGNVVSPNNIYYFGGANIVSNTYENGKGIITFDGGVTFIGGQGFRYCSSLTTITIPNSVTRVGGGIFYGCSNLESVVLSNNITSLPVDDSGKPAYGFFGSCSSLTSIVIPDSVTSIGGRAFEDCSSLTSVTIPNSVTNIEVNAFKGTGIYNDNSNWENDVFYIDNCLILAKESIPGTYTIKENTRLIANGAFAGCSSLTSIVIPDSVTSIGEVAFAGCSSLTSITFKGTMEEWNSITKGTNWNYSVPANYVQCTDGQVTL